MPNTWACPPAAGQGRRCAGTTGMADLLDGDGPAYHVLAFSAPNVDELTGDFGMEDPDRLRARPGWRAADRWVGDGQPVRGLADVRLSSETRVNTSYAGPVAMRFGGLQVAGRD